MCIYIYIFQILFHYRLLQGIGYSSLCCIVYLLCICFVYNMLLFIYLLYSSVYLPHFLFLAEAYGSSAAPRRSFDGGGAVGATGVFVFSRFFVRVHCSPSSLGLLTCGCVSESYEELYEMQMPGSYPGQLTSRSGWGQDAGIGELPMGSSRAAKVAPSVSPTFHQHFPPVWIRSQPGICLWIQAIGDF